MSSTEAGAGAGGPPATQSMYYTTLSVLPQSTQPESFLLWGSENDEVEDSNLSDSLIGDVHLRKPDPHSQANKGNHTELYHLLTLSKKAIFELTMHYWITFSANNVDITWSTYTTHSSCSLSLPVLHIIFIYNIQYKCVRVASRNRRLVH